MARTGRFHISAGVKSTTTDRSRCCGHHGRPWRVLPVLCTLSLTSLGQALGLGAIFNDVMLTFHTTRSLAGLVQSLCAGLGFGAGLVTGPLLQRAGPRVTVMAGSAVGALGCVLAYLATDIAVVIAGLGVMLGVGVSCNYLTSLVMAGLLFHDVRSIALTAVSVSGALGSAVFPIFLRYLVTSLSLHETFLVLGAVNLHMMVLGALLGVCTPPVGLCSPLQQQTVTVEPPTPHELELSKSSSNTNDQSEVLRVSSLNTRSHDKLEVLQVSLNTRSHDELQLQTSSLNSNTRSQEESVLQTISNSLSIEPEIKSDLQAPSLTVKPQPQNMLSTQCVNNIELPNYSSNTKPQNELELQASSLKPQLQNILTSQSQHESQLPISSSKHIYQKSTTHSGAAANRHSTPMTSLGVLAKAVVRSLHLHVASDVRFSLGPLLGTSLFASLLAPSIFLADMTRTAGLRAEDGALFLALLFAGNVLGRLAAGGLGHCTGPAIMLVFGLSMVAGGVTCFCFTFADSYQHFACVSASFGLSFGVFTGCVPLVCLEVVGPRLYTAAMGLASFTGGLAMCLAGPLGGLIHGATGSYSLLFSLALVHGVLAGLVVVVLYLRHSVCRKNQQAA